MKYRLLIICFSIFSFISISAQAQQTNWPKSFTTSAGAVKMYEPQPESYSGNLVKIKAAVSIIANGKTDPVFGVVWADVSLDNSNNNYLAWQSASVTNIKFPGDIEESDLNEVSNALESQLPSWNISSSAADLKSKVEENEKETNLSENLNTSPPKIIYNNKPSILVLIDGEPQFRDNTEWGVSQVVNTPFTIVKSTGQTYYLYGGKKWYSSTTIRGPWNYVQNLPSALSKVDREVRASDTTTTYENNISDIVVSTEPAELIQSKGEANMAPIKGTNLLYVTNSSNDIFLDMSSQQYYVLISGRWYKAPNLSSSWTFTSSKNLPQDFSRIPEGSAKDNVLASVAGTEAATESVLEAQVPQTARVDRKSATANVTYDGDPQFENIEGTNLKYAVNSPGSVINSGRKYYYVENGVWFESYNANGPWMVATERPPQVEFIPARYPVYNVKYVYIYDATPDYVYMGYTPGYLGTYIYGPTIVYGTGYYYKPWRGRYYYPRPMTWGFNMRYNPWTGWGFGVNLWAGWFSIHIGNYNSWPSWGGWWGPQVYRPMYSRPYGNYYGRNGYYGRGGNTIINNYTIINNRQNNIYRYRRDVVTNDRGRFTNNRYNTGVARPTANNNRGYNQPYNNGRTGNNYPNNNGRARDNYPDNGGRTRDYSPSNNGRVGNNIPDNNNRGGNNLPNQRPGNTIPGNPRPTRNYEPIDRSGADPRSNRTYENRNVTPRDIATPRENTIPGENPVRRYSNPDPRINNSQRPDVNSGRVYSPGREMPDRPVRVQQQRQSSPSPAMSPQSESRPSRSAGFERPQRPTGPVVRSDNGGSRSNGNGDNRPRRRG